MIMELNIIIQEEKTQIKVQSSRFYLRITSLLERNQLPIEY